MSNFSSIQQTTANFRGSDLSFHVSFSNPTIAENLIVVAFTYCSRVTTPSSPAPTDDGGNTYTLATSAFYNGSASGANPTEPYLIEIWYAYDANPATTITYSAVGGQTPTARVGTVFLQEFAGVKTTSSPLVNTSSSSSFNIVSSQNAVTLGTFSTTTSNQAASTGPFLCVGSTSGSLTLLVVSNLTGGYITNTYTGTISGGANNGFLGYTFSLSSAGSFSPTLTYGTTLYNTNGNFGSTNQWVGYYFVSNSTLYQTANSGSNLVACLCTANTSSTITLAHIGGVAGSPGSATFSTQKLLPAAAENMVFFMTDITTASSDWSSASPQGTGTFPSGFVGLQGPGLTAVGTSDGTHFLPIAFWDSFANGTTTATNGTAVQLAFPYARICCAAEFAPYNYPSLLQFGLGN